MYAMSVRDFSTETVAPETVPEPIPAGPAEQEAAAKFSAEGALPEVAARRDGHFCMPGIIRAKTISGR